MINQDRLAETFMALVRTDSVSREEGRICSELKEILREMNAEVLTDTADLRTGSDTGNLIARFAGNRKVPPLMLNAHMDTVEPGRGIDPVFRDGMFTSRGDTILGADDKSAIAILLECLRTVQENDLPCGPVELVLTTCEEIGLLGAKHLDFSLITARYGYALDTPDTGGIITRAPGANRFTVKILGRAAHAGAAPENGINAISIASRAIAELELGRLDDETTCNIGTIAGGKAINIVPELVTVSGEVRSHDPDKLKQVTDTILAAFQKAADACPAAGEDNLPRIEIELDHDFTRTAIPEDHPVVRLAQQAAGNLGRKIIPQITGGGADANVFFEKGIVTGVLGTGMRDMHTTNESIALADMVHMAELVLEILRLHAGQ